MRFAFLTNTPAHVHLYKHAVSRLKDRDHDVLVLGRDYGCTRDLLEYYDLPHEIYGKCDTTKLSLFTRLPAHYFGLLAAARRFDPDLIFGMGSYAAHTGALTRTPVVLILDSEPTTLDTRMARPFARTILTPHPFRKDLGPKHYVFQGFKETAYLHPDEFDQREDIRELLGVGPDERYVITRFNAFGSHHDVAEGGFTAAQRREFVETISQHATVFISDEGDDLDSEQLPARPYDLHPALMHDALAGADLLIADTQTMVTEAALLGTPAIRSNSFVDEDDDMGNFLELEDEGLIFNIRSYDDVLGRAVDLLTDDGTAERWQRKRHEFLSGMTNLTEVIVDIAESDGSLDRVDTVTSRAGTST
jgi:predicted glycosyltransferase